MVVGVVGRCRARRDDVVRGYVETGPVQYMEVQ